MSMSSLTGVKANPGIPDLAPGDTVRVSIKVVEGGKERVQPFQGVIIKLQRGGINASFTVRRIAYGVGVERTFPLYSPRVEKVEIIRHGKVHRAKLYYLRGRSGKAARIKERRVDREKKPPKARKAPARDELEPEAVPAGEGPVQEEQKIGQAQSEPEAGPIREETAQEAPEEVQDKGGPVPGEPEALKAQGELTSAEPETAKTEDEPEKKPEE